MASSTTRGHKINWDGIQWSYDDTGGPVNGTPNRACMKCGQAGEEDDCLGHLPGVKNACCGHGDRDRAYIQFDNGTVVRGFKVD